MPAAFAVVDVETNGCRPDADRVIEVAVVRVERRRIVERWRTFLRPDAPVPRWITRLTGITTDDVASAPAFDEAAGELLRRIGRAVFVAHNAAFDAGFLRAEFARTGRAWRPTVLCTLRLARRLIPDLGGWSLDALSSHFGVPIEHRHRALDDAAATAEILVRMLTMRGARAAVAKLATDRLARLRSPLPFGAEELPRSRGVWALRDRDGRVIATGRAVSLADKFGDDFASLPRRVAKAAARVDHVVCASDVEAQAAEADLAGPAPEPAFLTVAADGTMRAGAPGPGRIFGPFTSAAELARKMERARGLPIEDAIASITRGLKPLGFLRETGRSVLVRQDERLVWVDRGRFRRAWSIGPDTDEAEIRREIRALLDAPFDASSAPRVKASRGVPVEEFLRG
jgi:DNA polymerase III epsilon subunit family exonuclease